MARLERTTSGGARFVMPATQAADARNRPYVEPKLRGRVACRQFGPPVRLRSGPPAVD
jgi:hypothetical protein